MLFPPKDLVGSATLLTVPPEGFEVVKHMSLWEIFYFQTTIVVLSPPKSVRSSNLTFFKSGLSRQGGDRSRLGRVFVVSVG